MPVTDWSGGTLRCQLLPRNCGLRTTTHIHRYIRLLELAISVYVLAVIIKKRLKIDVSFYFKQIQRDQLIKDEAYNPDEGDNDNQLNLFN